jgi:hypothetical protein
VIPIEEETRGDGPIADGPPCRKRQEREVTTKSRRHGRVVVFPSKHPRRHDG